MNPDLALVIGIVIGAFAIPSVVSAMTEARTPRVASIVVIASVALIAWAVTEKPGGYRLDEIPEIFVQVMRGFLS